MELDGKILAIILWGKKDGEEEVSAHTGTMRKTGASYEFYRGEGRPTFNLEPEWLVRIKVVTDELEGTLLNADFSLSLTVGPIPEDMDISELLFTGLQISAEE